MTRTLKKRFIMFTMTAVSCLLLFIVLAINGLNGIMLERRSDMVLRTLMDADGAFHKMDFRRPPPFSPPLDMDRMRASRFFIVKTGADGTVSDINMEQISSVDAETARRYAEKVLRSGDTSGQVEGYKFAIKATGEDRLIFFMDNSEQTESFFTVLMLSCVIAALCWLVLLGIVIGLSGRVLRPVIEGMEKQKQFITNAGHEMKTPLAIIQSNNDAMALICGENKYNIHIRNQTRRLNVLMSNLLTLAKLDEGLPMPLQPVSIKELANELLGVYQEQAQRRNVSFEAAVQDITAQTNADSLRQLLTILLDNAVKYTTENGRIVFSIQKEGKRIRVVEENTCDKAAEPDPEKLFDRFYRGDAARTQREDLSGYGIGLSAARAICENFGGTLTAKYTADGIRFTAEF